MSGPCQLEVTRAIAWSGRLCFGCHMQMIVPPQDSRPSLRPPSFRAARTILALILREMGATYGNSPGGYIWAVLQPLGMIYIMSIAFSLFVRSPALGTSFILFYATGYLPYGLYGEISSKTARALRYSSALLAYPGVTWIDALLARFILTLLTDVAVMCIVITAILLSVDTHTVINIVPIGTAIFLAALFGLGVGLMNCLLGGLFPLYAIAWGIVSRPLMIASCVLFLYEDVPRVVQDILWWNPLVHVTGLFRRGVFPTYDATYVSLTYGFGMALTLIALGLIFLRAYYKNVLEK